MKIMKDRAMTLDAWVRRMVFEVGVQRKHGPYSDAGGK